MTTFLGDYTAEFMLGRRGRPKGSKDKKPRQRRIGRDALNVASAGGTGAGLGFAGVGLLPVRSKTVDKALVSKRMNRLPVVGKRLRGMAMNQQKGYDRLARKSGQYLAANLPAQTAAGLAAGAVGLGIGANQVRRSRRKARLSAGRR